MTQISVALPALEELARALSDVGERIGASGAGLHPTHAHVAGHVGLAAALEEFADSWRRGLRRTAEAAGVAGTQLREAAGHYRQVDTAVAGACG
jgi:uncharacterized protein YukE